MPVKNCLMVLSFTISITDYGELGGIGDLKKKKKVKFSIQMNIKVMSNSNQMLMKAKMK